MAPTRPASARGLRTLRLAAVLLAVVLAVLLLPACEDDGPTGLFPSGSIRITTTPEFLPADWELVGPEGFETTGRGHELLERVRPGSYTITWSDMPLQSTPPPETREVAVGETVSFHGDYTLDGPDHGDELMLRFEQCHEYRSYDAYDLIVDEEFRFIPQGGVDPWGRDVEMDIMLRMFSEIAGDGGLVVAHMSVDQLDPVGIWTQTPPNDPYFGAFTDDSMYRTYDMELHVVMAGVGLVYRIEGSARFYAIGREENGRQRWRLLGVVDQTIGEKATETMSWTQLKLLFD